MAITRAQQARQMLKKGGEPVVQGGVENYLGRQPEVQAPRKWQSGPDKPPTELAYITEAEKKLLLKEDIHGSLKDGPNEGPAGIMSLDSFGDIGGGQAGAEVDSDRREDRPEKTTFSPVKAGSENYKSRIKSPADIKLEQEKLQNIIRNEETAAKKFTKQAKQQRSFFNQLKKFSLPSQRILYNVLPNNPSSELAFLSGLTKQQVDALDNKELSDLYDTIQDTEFFGEESFKDALGDDFKKLSFDAFKALSQRGIESGFIDPQGEFGNMDYAEYAARIKGQPGLLYSGNVGGLIKIKNPDGTFRYERRDDQSPQDISESELERRLRLLEEQNAALRNQTAATGSSPLFRLMADGGMTDDAPIEGGIMDLESAREMMFLGGIVKGLKKIGKSATRAIRKVAKSPIGKAALLGIGGSFALGLGPFASGSTMFGGKLAGLKGSGFLKSAGLKDFFIKDGALTGKGISTLLLGAPFIGDILNLNKPKEEPDLYAGPSLDFNAQLYNRFMAKGGRAEPVAKKTMPLLDLDGQEMDFRAEGGFVPIGRMEKADDVPARLSKNEFVFTADAVRNAGGGDVDKGAEVMYNTMKNLEAGGEMSDESQGLDGARNMFQTSQRLGEVI